MELIDRYLQAIRFWLPKQQQDDIIAEISEDLSAQIEERESALGHPLAKTEVEALLRKRGSPILVANGYLPQRSLIGPLLFPIYIFALKVVTLVSLIPAVVGFIAGVVSRVLGNIVGTGWTPPFEAIARGFWSGWFTSLAVVTLIFAIIERTGAKKHILETWNPGKLPPLRPANLIPRSGSAIEIVVNLCVAVWWVTNMASPVTLHPGTFRIALAPVWTTFFWTGLLLIIASGTLALANFIRPWWTTQRVVLRLCLDALGAVFFCAFLRVNIVASIAWPGMTPAKAAAALAGLNLWLVRIFPWAVGCCLVIVALSAARLVRVRRRANARPIPAVAA